jgi:hypothetical protein
VGLDWSVGMDLSIEGDCSVGIDFSAATESLVGIDFSAGAEVSADVDGSTGAALSAGSVVSRDKGCADVRGVSLIKRRSLPISSDWPRRVFIDEPEVKGAT